MAIDGNVTVRGLREIRVKRGLQTAILPAAQTLKFTERVTAAELRGNDKVVDSSTFVEAIDFQITEGGIPLEAYAIMTGRTLVAAGTGTAETMTMTVKAGDIYPYFTLYGKSIGNVGDDVHVKLFNCKLTAGMDGTLADGAYYITTISGVAVDDGTGNLMDIVRNETAIDLAFPA